MPLEKGGISLRCRRFIRTDVGFLVVEEHILDVLAEQFHTAVSPLLVGPSHPRLLLSLRYRAPRERGSEHD
jgi:hypothetical protein